MIGKPPEIAEDVRDLAQFTFDQYCAAAQGLTPDAEQVLQERAQFRLILDQEGVQFNSRTAVGLALTHSADRLKRDIVSALHDVLDGRALSSGEAERNNLYGRTVLTGLEVSGWMAKRTARVKYKTVPVVILGTTGNLLANVSGVKDAKSIGQLLLTSWPATAPF